MSREHASANNRRFGGSHCPLCRIEDAARKLQATIDAHGNVANAERDRIGRIDDNYIVYDAFNKRIGTITPEMTFIDQHNRVAARLHADWTLVGADEKILAVVRQGMILGRDMLAQYIYHHGDPKKVVAWFVFLSQCETGRNVRPIPL